MTQTPYTPPPKNRWMIPLILSVMVHTILVAVLWFWRPSPPVFIDHGIQTNLITSGDIAEIEGQIRENARLASQAQDGQDSQESSSQAQLSPHMQAYNDELAQKEAEFQAQIAKFAQELDAETLADMQALDAELAQRQAEQQALLEQSRQAFENHDETITQNQQALDEARKARDELIAEANAKQRQSGGKDGSLSAGKPTGTAQSGTNAKRTTQASGGSSASEIISALIRLIEPKWRVPSNASGEKLKASIRVDTNTGNVLSVSISGGTPALRASLEDAIYSASPLTPVVGTDHRTLNITFTAD